MNSKNKYIRIFLMFVAWNIFLYLGVSYILWDLSWIGVLGQIEAATRGAVAYYWFVLQIFFTLVLYALGE